MYGNVIFHYDRNYFAHPTSVMKYNCKIAVTRRDAIHTYIEGYKYLQSKPKTYQLLQLLAAMGIQVKKSWVPIRVNNMNIKSKETKWSLHFSF